MAQLRSQLQLVDLLSPDRIKIPLESTDKDALIRELCALLATASGLTDEEEDEVREAVLEREAVLSTGIGDGVAIPHGKSEHVDGLVMVAGRTRGPVDFEALDDKPVQLILLLVGPESASSVHVKVLSRISRVLRDGRLRERLIAADSAGEFLSRLREAEGR